MAWYNNSLNSQNYIYFNSNIEPANFLTPKKLYDEANAIIGNHENHERHLDSLDMRLSLAWSIIEKIQENSEFVRNATHHSHLKGLNKNSAPYYTACFYVCGNNPIDNIDTKIINLSIESNDVFVEIRYPLAEFFSVEEFSTNYPGVNLGFINGLPKFSIRSFKEFIDNGGSVRGEDGLLKFLLEYISRIEIFLTRCGKLRTAGESLAEIQFKQALEAFYGNMNNNVTNWLRHGHRPIQFNNGRLEIDLLMTLRDENQDADQTFAFEIQGPHHYIDLNPHNQDWDNIENRHKAKIKWCMERNYAFVWVDWMAFHKIFVINGQRPYPVHERNNRIRIWIDEVIDQYDRGCRCISLITEERSHHLPQVQYMTWCNTIGFLRKMNMVHNNLYAHL